MFPDFPLILGHEGSGIVESVGAGVAHVKPGDKVIPCAIAQCRKCQTCKRGDWNWCEFRYVKWAFPYFTSEFRASSRKGVLSDGTTRFKCKGKAVNHFFSTCSTFTEYAVLPAENVVKVITLLRQTYDEGSKSSIIKERVVLHFRSATMLPWTCRACLAVASPPAMELRSTPRQSKPVANVRCGVSAQWA